LADYQARRTAELAAARKRVAEGRETWGPEEWEAKLGTALQQKVSFDFVDTNLDEVLRFLHALAGVSIVLDPHVGGQKDARVTLALTNVSLASALDLVTHLCGLSYGLRSEAVWLTTPKRLEAYRARTTAELERRRKAGPAPEPPEWENRIRTALKQKVSFEFAETALGEVLRFLKALTGVDFVLDPELAERGKEPVTLALTNVSLASALDLITDQTGLSYVLKDGAVHILRADQ
jgi:type II secretory pathway component HofQ